MAAKLYKDYFEIDPKYFPQVTKSLIEDGKVSWKSYFANDSFIQILNQTCDMINGQKDLSMFAWGPYGSGKSHLVLTLISMLKASDSEIKEYFEDQHLSNDLMNKFIATKNSGKIIAIHRIGSANIDNETDLIIAVQQSIMKALEEYGITNQGEASMKDSFLDYLKDEDNRVYFQSKIKKYAFEFGESSVDDIVKVITGENLEQSEEMMRKVMMVMKKIGQYGILKDANAMSAWIKDIIDKNNIKAIVFAWDEFSEFLLSHPMGLTGLQTLVEISSSYPFYFILVAHEAQRIFADAKSAKKFLDRFQKPVEISLPENTAFKLLAQAMKTTTDPVLSEEWKNKIIPAINDSMIDVRRQILGTQRANRANTSFTDEDLKSIAPIHPYAALILKQIASMFNSNQRSMFDFVINDSADTPAFKHFIRTHSPFEDPNVLTVDMLWDFFCGKQVSGLSDDVRGIFLSYDGLKSESLLPEEQRVLKTILIMQAVSVRISNDDLLSPTEQTVDLAFKGTGWAIGKALSIAKGLYQKNLVFEKPMANGRKEFCVRNGNVDGDDIEKYRAQAKSETKTSGLIVSANLPSAVPVPKSVEMRYRVEYAADSSMTTAINNHYKGLHNERIKTIVTFAMDDVEAQKIQQQIIKNINMPTNDIVFIETLSPMGKNLYDQYIDAMAFSKYYTTRDKAQAAHYSSQAEGVLRQWAQNITNGAFKVYTVENKNGTRMANLSDLQNELRKYDIQKYPTCLEQYTLNATLYGAFNLAQGAELGVKEETKSAYHIGNPNLSIENALNGAWKVPNYWEDTSKQSLVIVKVKKKINEIIEDSFKKNNGEVSILSIFDEMEKPPFGFMPNSITSFVLGFCLKEYANANYFWSNHSNTETMTVDKMKAMISNALAQRTNESKNYKPEYIVTMTPQMRAFLDGSSAIFAIPDSQCTSIEATRDQIRIKMKGFQFPIWCIKYLLDKETFESSKDLVEKVIDGYTGIANTANSNKSSESVLAEEVGTLFINNQALIPDMKKLICDGKCRDGMIEYISRFNDGELRTLAAEIADNGAYIDVVRKKFNASDGNWVWNTQTADEKIADVILEYKIIKESNKSLSACHSITDVITEWNRRTNYIKMPCEAAAKATGDLGMLLWQLSSIKRNNCIAEQDKQNFYTLLCTQREAFDKFYKDQLPYFKADANSLLTDLSDEDIAEIYNDLPGGQFTKGKTEYYNFVKSEIDKYLQSQLKKQMKELWLAKTCTKDPAEWSAKYRTPILCMIDDDQRSTARKMFDIINSSNPSESDTKVAIEFIKNADFYDRLNDSDLRDKMFMEIIVGSNSVLLNNINEIRDVLEAKVSYEPAYHWLGSSAVEKQIKTLADKEYKLKGSERANQIIDQMDATQLREYLKRRIEDDAEFGMQILKGE